MYERRHTPTFASLGRPQLLRYHVSFILFFNLALLVCLVLRPGSDSFVTSIDNLMQFTGPLLVLAIWILPIKTPEIYRAVVNHTPTSAVPRSLAPFFLSLGVLFFALGQIIWTYYELILKQSLPMPSWADVFFLSEYPCFLIGILLLPGRRLSRSFRTRVTLDGLMIMSATATISWYFILGPTVKTGQGSVLEKVVGLAYPLGDLVLIGCLLLLATRVGNAAYTRIATILVLGLGSIIVTDSSFILQTLWGTYATGALMDSGWPLGYMLVALGAHTARHAAALPAQPLPSIHNNGHSGMVEEDFIYIPRLWQSLFPYAIVPLVGALLIYALRVQGDDQLEVGVYIGSIVLVGLLFLRQVFAILENTQLYRTLRLSYSALKVNNEALAEANERLAKLSTIDPLTELPNHRAMVTALDGELERGQRWNQSFAVLFFDLDHFKALNDTYGHGHGDAVLREFGMLVCKNLRAVDSFGRWGGEEFVALLPQTDAGIALSIAERVRAAVAAHTFTSVGLHLTCSIGVAVYPMDGEDRNHLVADADHAMYAAKHLGRNQVRAANDPALNVLKAGLRGSREETALTGTVDALAELVAMRDKYTGEHTQAVAALTIQIAQALGCDHAEAYLISMAGRLHDIGKVALPDAVLRKPGRLNEEEWALIRTHPIVGADVVSRVPSLRVLAPTIRSHHERWDGTGYPDGLVGEAIPLGARIVAVADAYAAMTSERPYRQARSAAQALAELQRCAGTQFDQSVVAALAQLLESSTGCPDMTDTTTYNATLMTLC